MLSWRCPPLPHRVYAELALPPLPHRVYAELALPPLPHRVYAELALHYILRVASGLLSRPLHEQQEREHAMAELPPPMLHGNWEPATPSCFFSDNFRSRVVEAKARSCA